MKKPKAKRVLLGEGSLSIEYVGFSVYNTNHEPREDPKNWKKVRALENSGQRVRLYAEIVPERKK